MDFRKYCKYYIRKIHHTNLGTFGQKNFNDYTSVVLIDGRFIFSSTLLFSIIIFFGKSVIDLPLFNLSITAIIVLAFGLSFSSTVYAVKVLGIRG